TFNSGPVSGLMGAHHVAKALGIHNVVMADMGGTSFDVGLVVKDSVRSYDFRPVIDRWMVGITMIKTLSIGAGGGSIAWLNKLLRNQLQVGPRSAGSLPGPVCFNRGGAEPTVTDADVVLGYINPEYYFGGKLVLNKDKAYASIRDKIAKPLGTDVEAAAAIIRKIVDGNMTSAIVKEVHLRGYSPEEFILFAAGGAGATHLEGFRANIPKAVIFPFSPVFCAYGSSTMDIMHVYERSRKLTLMEPGTRTLSSDCKPFNDTVQSLMDDAKRDLAGEGLDPSAASFVLELDMLYGGQFHVKRTLSPLLFLRGTNDVQTICDAFEKEFSEAFSPFVVNPEGGVFVESFVLKAIVPTKKVSLPKLPMEKSNPEAALKGTRPAYWPERQAFTPTNVYSFERLRPGNVIAGPAIVEGEYTTMVIPFPLRFSIDEHGLGILEKRNRFPMPIPTLAEKLEWLKPAPPTDFEKECVKTIRPGDYEIGVQTTNDILDEAMEVFVRSSRSYFGVSGDSMVAIFTAEGDLINASCGTYLHAIIQPIIIKFILKYYKDNPGIRDGDVWYTNDALYGGIHNPDQVAIMPVFHEGRLIAWSTAALHTTETGAVEPGGMPVTAKSRFEE